MSIRVGINGFGRMGRLIGTVLSGWVFQVAGLVAFLCISTAFVAAAALISAGLPRHGRTHLNTKRSTT